MKKDNFYFIVAGVLFLIIVGSFIYFGGLLSKAQEISGLISWSTDGLSGCALNLSGYAAGDRISKGGAVPASGTERISLEDLINFNTGDLIQLWDEVRDGLPLSVTGVVACRDNTNQAVSLTVNVNIPRINEPKFIEQIKKQAVPLLNQESSRGVISWSWSTAGLYNCVLNASGKMAKERLDINDNFIPASGGEQLSSEKITRINARDLIQFSDEIREAVLPLSVNGTIACRDNANRPVSLTVNADIPQIGEPVFIRQFRSLLDQFERPASPSSPSPVTEKCGIAGDGKEFRPFSNVRSGAGCPDGFGAGFAAACYDGTLQLTYPENSCFSKSWWYEKARAGCANHCISGAVSDRPNISSAVVSRLNKALIEITQGMLKTLNLLMQRPSDPIVNDIINIFSDLVKSIQNIINDLR